MKTKQELMAYLDCWLDSAESVRSDYDHGMFVGYVLALSTVLDDKESKAKARAAINALKERSP